MKRLIAAGVLAIVIAVPCVAGYLILTDFEKNLSEIMEKAYDSAVEKDYESAAAFGKEAEEYFVRREKLVGIFVDHELVEILGECLSKLAPLSEKETIAEFISELSSARTALKHLLNDQRPVINNIL